MPEVEGTARARQRGQALVEFALVLPVFAVITLGVVDAARVFSANVAISNAVREAVVYAGKSTNFMYWCRQPGNAAQADAGMPVSVPCPTGSTAANYAADPTNIAYRIAADASGLDRARITLDPPKCGPGPGLPTATCTSTSVPKYVTVRITYSMDLVTPLIGNIWGNPVTISATATGRASQ